MPAMAVQPSSASGFMTPLAGASCSTRPFMSPAPEASSRSWKSSNVLFRASGDGNKRGEDGGRGGGSGHGGGSCSGSRSHRSSSGPAGVETGNGASKNGSSKRGFKRMVSGIASPAHFRRSLSFAGSMSAISNAANRVAAGAMTPIRRRQQRRDVGGSGEHSTEGCSRHGEPRIGSDCGGESARSNVWSSDVRRSRSSHGSDWSEPWTNQSGLLTPEGSQPRSRKPEAVVSAQVTLMADESSTGWPTGAAQVKPTAKRAEEVPVGKHRSGVSLVCQAGPSSKIDWQETSGGAANIPSGSRRRAQMPHRQRPQWGSRPSWVLKEAESKDLDAGESSSEESNERLAPWSWETNDVMTAVSTEKYTAGVYRSQEESGEERVSGSNTGRREENSGLPPNHDGGIFLSSVTKYVDEVQYAQRKVGKTGTFRDTWRCVPVDAKP